jgi:phage terminase small subunit|tara:strand:+ start:233 stop:706 length:474 start_codon:yes stop_codon:yes gene_type:complete
MKNGTLTPRQEKFAQNVAKGMTKTQAALDAGYSPKNAQKAGTALASNQNPKIKNRISVLRERAANLVSLNLSTHLTDLKDLRDGAMNAGMWSAAVAAEVARGRAAGLYVHKSELTINKVELMSKEEVLVRMQELYYETGGILPKGTLINLPVEDYDG